MAARLSGALAAAWLAVASAQAAQPVAPAGVVTRVATKDKVLFLTFDACQAVQRMTLDHGIIDPLVARHIPFTIFVGGRFARDNAADLKALAQLPFVDLENHSWSHPRDMRLLSDDEVRTQVERAAATIRSVTGRRTRLFRFPGGNADERTLAIVNGLGYTVVHWRWPEGDPDPAITADQLVAQSLARSRPGDILIFHVNGRGWHTAEALPRILDGLAARGFRFASLPDYIAAP
jgi:peptidoglycan/xylan/chitin deacetylase (PgdA/CDA1 family)